MPEGKPRKTFHHSTVGRRDFMKYLGLGSVGMGAVAMGLPSEMPFADLDEMMASPQAERKLPFWVKEVDEPTVQIDWENMEIFPHPGMTLFNPASWPDGEWERIRNKNIAATTEHVKNNTPGYAIRDRALGDANCWGWDQLAFSRAGPGRSFSGLRSGNIPP